MTEDEIGRVVVDAAIEVHRHFGPGLLESIYEAALAHELAARHLVVQRQVGVVVDYRGLTLGEGFKIDLLIASTVLVELKSVERLVPVHRKQVVSYLRLSNLRLGYLINFNVPMLKQGIVRLVNQLPE